MFLPPNSEIKVLGARSVYSSSHLSRVVAAHWLMYRPLKRSDPHSQTPKKQQDDKEKNDHAQTATRIITPAAAVRPSWQRAHGHQQQNYQQYD
jgi:hypothetical protein